MQTMTPMQATTVLEHEKQARISWPEPLDLKAAVAPVRVCFLIDELAAAGTETQLLALIHSLDRTRVAPYLCLLRGDSRPRRRWNRRIVRYFGWESAPFVRRRP